MKTTKHSSERTQHSFFRSAGSWRAETALFATLGLSALIAIVAAAEWGSVPAGPRPEPLAALRKSPVVKYVVSGRLAADARTAAAMVDYLLQPERPLVTNLSVQGLTEKNLVVPRNKAAPAPKA